jgi:hypothetical protein
LKHFLYKDTAASRALLPALKIVMTFYLILSKENFKTKSCKIPRISFQGILTRWFENGLCVDLQIFRATAFNAA